MVSGYVGNLIAYFQVKPILEEEIIKKQAEDPELRKLAEEVRCERNSNYAFGKDGMLVKEKRLYVPKDNKLKKVF